MARIKVRKLHERLRLQGKPHLAVLRNNLSATNWSIRLSNEDDIEPFLTAAAAALETEPSEYLSRLEITPLENTEESCITVLPVHDQLADQGITKAEQRLLVFLQETGVLPPGADLEALSQWGQENDLPYREDLRREANSLHRNEVIKEILPGVSVVLYGGGVAQAAARAAAQTDASGVVMSADDPEPLNKAERRLLRYLIKTRTLPLNASRADLFSWCRSQGIYRRVDIQRTGSALKKSGMTGAEQKAYAQNPQAVRVGKCTAEKARDSAVMTKDGRLGTKELVAWLQEGGSMTLNATANRALLSLSVSDMQWTMHINHRQSASTQMIGQGEGTTPPGLAERLAERAEFKTSPSKQPGDINGHATDWHVSKSQLSLKDLIGSRSHDTSHAFDEKEYSTGMKGELKSLKRRSLIAPDATLEDLSKWKKANVLSGETWYETLQRCASERNESYPIVNERSEDMDLGYRHSLTAEESFEQLPTSITPFAPPTADAIDEYYTQLHAAQLQDLKTRSLLAPSADTEDLLQWKAVNVDIGESWPDTLTRLVSKRIEKGSGGADRILRSSRQKKIRGKGQGQLDALKKQKFDRDRGGWEGLASL